VVFPFRWSQRLSPNPVKFKCEKHFFHNSNRCSEPIPAPQKEFILQIRTAARLASPMMGQKTGHIAAKPPARRAIQQNKNGGAVSAKSPCSRPTMAGLKQ
jgi:hypothetical protein